MGLACPVPSVSVVAVRVIVPGRQATCRLCCKRNPVLSFRFADVDVEVSACSRCDGLRAKTPKELR